MIRITGKIWNVLAEKERKTFRTLICSDIIISLLDLFFLAALVYIIQFYVQGDNRLLSEIPPPFNDTSSPALLIVFFTGFVVKNIAAVFIVKHQYIFYSKVAARLSTAGLEHFQLSPFENFRDTETASHIRKINFLPFDFCQYLLSGMQQLITQTFFIAATLCALLLLDAKLFLVLLAVLLPPVALVFYVIRRKLLKEREQVHQKNERSLQALLDALGGYKESRIYQSAGFFLNRYSVLRAAFSRHLFNMLGTQTLPPRFIESFAVLGLLVLVIMSTGSPSGEDGLFFTIAAFMAAAYKVIPGMVKLVNLSGQMSAHEKILSDISANTVVSENGVRKKITSIRAVDVGCAYPGKKPLFSKIDFELTPGSFLVVTGPSGCGKTTLLHHLLGFMPPSKGRFLVNGVSRSASGIQDYWCSVAYVGQQAFLFHDTLAANICFEHEASNRMLLDRALHFSGLSDFVAAHPQGLNMMIAEKGKNISGGQQQRIALARAVYRDADLIILDEPFNELDQESEHSILANLARLAAEGKMIVLVTHNKDSFGYCNQIIQLDDEKEENAGVPFAGISGVGSR